jgi:hypothetical protein
MPVGSDQLSAARSSQSELHRRAIGAACDLLMAGIWVERQIKNAARFQTHLVGSSRWLGRPVQLFNKPEHCSRSRDEES